jgi:hypothetical protein
MARHVLHIMMGRAVIVDGVKHCPTVAEQLQACTWLADRAYGRPSSMLELLVADELAQRRREQE